MRLMWGLTLWCFSCCSLQSRPPLLSITCLNRAAHHPDIKNHWEVPCTGSAQWISNPTSNTYRWIWSFAIISLVLLLLRHVFRFKHEKETSCTLEIGEINKPKCKVLIHLCNAPQDLSHLVWEETEDLRHSVALNLGWWKIYNRWWVPQ